MLEVWSNCTVKLCVEFGAARHLCSRVSGCGNLCATLKKATEAGRPSMSAWMYDVFDLHDEQVRKVTKPKISLYHAVMEHGVIRVPDYDSEDVLKGGTAAC